MIRKLPAALVLLALTTAASAFFMLGLGGTKMVSTLRHGTEDVLFSFRAKISPPSEHLKELIIVGVDDESFRVMDRSWPWPRDLFASFVKKLEERKPKIVAFDIVFRGAGADPRSDEAWAAAIREAGNIVLGGYYGTDRVPVLPSPGFLSGALSAGLVDKPQDADGACRKAYATRFRFKEWEGYSLGAEMAYRSLGADPAAHIREEKGGVRYLDPAAGDGDAGSSRFVRTSRSGETRISFRYRPEKFFYVPFWKVLDGSAPPSLFEGKTVLVGPISPIFHDIHSTPLGRMPGVFINANEALMILEKDFISEPFEAYAPLAMVLFGALFTLGIFRLAFVFQLAVYALLSAAVYGASLLLICRSNVLIEPFSPIAVMTINFFVVASWKALKTFLDNIALHRQVITDSLTGLYGHRFLTLKLASIHAHSMTSKSEFCVAMLDADHFKKVNDTYGHDMGNVVLVSIAKVMKQHVRRQDIAARFGGEEFCVVLIGTDASGAKECLERMRKAIEALEFTSDKGVFKVTISSGVCSSRNPAAKNSDEMLKLADQALYAAKTQGRNQVCVA